MGTDKKKKKDIKNFKEFDPEQYIEVEPKLTEAATSDTVVFTFGRMNPPTIGHEKLVDKVKDIAKKENADARVYLSHTQNSKKDPLSYEQKYYFANKAFGSVVKKSPARQIIQIAEELFKSGYKSVILVVGQDRVKELGDLLKKYNGKGDYEFKNINVISAGQRDPDAEGVEGMSGTKIRSVAKSGDFETFKKAAASKLSDSEKRKMMNMVQKGIKEETEGDSLDETVLTRAQRRKRALVMRKYKSKIAMARKRALKKRVPLDVLKGRARKAARNLLKQKLAKSTRYADMSDSQKQAIEKRLDKMPASRLDRLARKILPSLRKKEQERMMPKKESLNLDELFENFLDQRQTTGTNEYFTEASYKDQRILKKPHMLMNANKSVKLDGRFKMFKNRPEVKEDFVSVVEELVEAVDEFAGKNNLEEVSSMQLSMLKKAYEPFRGKRLSLANSIKLGDIVRKMAGDKESLMAIAKEDIPFVSDVAIAILISNHNMKGADIKKAMGEEFQLDEKSVSVAQQRLMGMALALKRGEMDADGASDEVKDLAKSMSMKDLEDFAGTKHKGLPMHKEGKKEDEMIIKRDHRLKVGQGDIHKKRDYELDEILDSPEAMKSYLSKAKDSKEKAASSAAKKVLRGPDKDGNRLHPAKELKTMAKRTAGERMANKRMVREEIHPDVVKAYKKTLDAEDKAGDYNYRSNKARVTRAANHLSKMINKHHPGLDMQGKIKLRTQLQNMKEEVELDEGAKTHFVYQRGVPKTKQVVHRGTEQSSKEWIQKNAKHFIHKGRDFDIYKGKYPNVKPSDRVDFRYVAEEVELEEAKMTDAKNKEMMRKALGVSKLGPKHANHTTAYANNGDFVVRDGGGRVVGRITKDDLNEAREPSMAKIHAILNPTKNAEQGIQALMRRLKVDRKTAQSHMDKAIDSEMGKTRKEEADPDTVAMIQDNPNMKDKILRGLDPKSRKEVEAALKNPRAMIKKIVRK